MMKYIIFFLLFSLSIESKAQNKSIYDFSVISIKNNEAIPLSNFRGKKILLVNTASLCASVNQFAELETLYQKFKDSGLVIIACPSNSFNSESGSNEEIWKFCKDRFQISFEISQKVEVIGDNAAPLFLWIAKKDQNGIVNGKIKSNFSKFLINGNGQIVGLFGEMVRPMDDAIIRSIRAN